MIVTPNSLTLVVVAHGRASVLGKTLAGLAQCEQPPAFRGTIVAENGPPCGMEAEVAKYADRLRIEHLKIADGRKSVALNEALRHIGDGWALFIDDDVRVNSDWVMNYATAIAHEPNDRYFGGPTAVDYEQRPVEWLIPYFPESAKGLVFSPETQTIAYPQCFLGFNWAAPVKALLDQGGFPEQYGPGTPLGGGDESFMQLRLTRAGLKGRVLHNAQVWHQVPANRCTPEWCLKRFRAGGFSMGIVAETYDRNRPQCCGRIRSHMRHLRTQLASWPWPQVFRLAPEGRFAVRQTMTWMTGFIAGYRSSRRNEYVLP